MPSTYTPLATTTVSGSSTYSVTFSSISGSYTDLILVAANVSFSTAAQTALRFNCDTGNNYSWTVLTGSGSTAGSLRGSNVGVMQLGYYYYADVGTNYTAICQINNYSNTTSYKTALARGNEASLGVGAAVGLWRNTAAITSVTFLPSYGGGYIGAGATFTLYGVKSA
jgi:hypothetical protein